jgi:hypothetical protein
MSPNVWHFIIGKFNRYLFRLAICFTTEPYLGYVTRVTTRRREEEDSLRIDVACNRVTGLDKGLPSSCNTTNSTRRPSYHKLNNIIYHKSKLITASNSVPNEINNLTAPLASQTYYFFETIVFRG